MSVLNDLLYPVDPSEFYKDYWEKKHLYIENQTNKFKELFTYEKLTRYLNTHAHSLQYPEIRVTLNTEHVSPSEYQEEIKYFSVQSITKTKVDPKKLLLLIKKNASLVLSDLQEYDLDLQKFAHSLSDSLGKQINLTLFHSAPGRNSFKNHCDPESAFIIQLEGKKNWSIFQAPAENENSNSEKVKANLKVEDNFTLAPGDVLYLPKGVWHNAYGEHGFSLSITVTITSSSKLDFLIDVIESYLLIRLSREKEFSLGVPISDSDLVSLKGKFSKCMSKYLEELSDNEWRTLFESFENDKRQERGNSSYNYPFEFRSDE